MNWRWNVAGGQQFAGECAEQAADRNEDRLLVPGRDPAFGADVFPDIFRVEGDIVFHAVVPWFSVNQPLWKQSPRAASLSAGFKVP